MMIPWSAARVSNMDTGRGAMNEVTKDDPETQEGVDGRGAGR
jgi:hypothetical protein